MKKLMKMFALTMVLCAPMCFIACQEEEIVEPINYETGDSDATSESKDDLD